MNEMKEQAIRQVTDRILSMRHSAHSDASIRAALIREGWAKPCVDIAFERLNETP